MAAIDSNGDQKYWINGVVFEGVRFQPTDTGSQKFWQEGLPTQNITPRNNSDTGKFLAMFE